MGIIAEIFRVEDWRRTPIQVWASFVAWVVVAISTNLILILVEWPTAPWRLLMALLAGVLSSGLVRWLVSRKQPVSANPFE
ncbi:hypothetical protein [Arthrobacter sp. NIO-1057]|uniref:hypothetical protein n=1 Tax=Arthrobacter sp. NIO-1057 TaxID=993071 RepID=UPI00071C64D9|nr:hypothetical protein [Arthrobacter sp. NIO-1057]KSU66583.1 hypothetical protein AS038_07880 [Arthrobacter sp. NIO-1057]SCC18345.1 hypothetical protein GA0061084_1596 [Arthrobacter sp. NIO-1057]